MASKSRVRRQEEATEHDADRSQSEPELRLTALAYALCERTLQLQREAIDQDFSTRLRLSSECSGAAGIFARQWLDAWVEGWQHQLLVMQITLDIARQAQAQLILLPLGRPLEASAPADAAAAGNTPADRRSAHKVITFPDRRVALAAAVDALVARAESLKRSGVE